MAFTLSEGIGAIGEFLTFILENIIVFVTVILFALLFFLVQYLFYRLYKWIAIEGFKLFFKLMEGFKGDGFKKTIDNIFG